MDDLQSPTGSAERAGRSGKVIRKRGGGNGRSAGHELVRQTQKQLAVKTPRQEFCIGIWFSRIFEIRFEDAQIATVRSVKTSGFEEN